MILAAGPVANFLVAMLLITGFELTQLNSDPGKVVERRRAARPPPAPGMRPGDSIRTVNGKPINAPENIQQDEEAAAAGDAGRR